jgi:NAD(P)-dependent dehydrogenase (short-subunit alcohol dehydrogenase family)
MKPGSAIINTASINSEQPSPQLLAYAATKGAIANFTAGLAQLLAEKGIRVNCVAAANQLCRCSTSSTIASTAPSLNGFWRNAAYRPSADALMALSGRELMIMAGISRYGSSFIFFSMPGASNIGIMKSSKMRLGSFSPSRSSPC